MHWKYCLDFEDSIEEGFKDLTHIINKDPSIRFFEVSKPKIKR